MQQTGPQQGMLPAGPGCGKRGAVQKLPAPDFWAKGKPGVPGLQTFQNVFYFLPGFTQLFLKTPVEFLFLALHIEEVVVR
jgi:hypothetical protein